MEIDGDQFYAECIDSRRCSTGCTIWFTGSGAKVPNHLYNWFKSHGYKAKVFDDDCFRKELNSDLEDEKDFEREHVRRAAELSKYFNKCGELVVASLTSEYAEQRSLVKQIHDNGALGFVGCHMITSSEVSKLSDFKESGDPDIILDASAYTMEECVEIVLCELEDRGYIQRRIQSLHAEETKIEQLKEEAEHLPQLELTTVDLQFLQILAEGWATPLKGFMREKELIQCLRFMFINNGSLQSQSLPIVLPVHRDDKIRLERQRKFALTYNNNIYAILYGPEFYDYRKEEFAALAFCTTSSGHPMIARINESGDYLVGGNITVIRKIVWDDGLDEFRLTPLQLKEKFRQYRADVVCAFLLRGTLDNDIEMRMAETRKRIVSQGYSNPLLLVHISGDSKPEDISTNIFNVQKRKIKENKTKLGPDNTIFAIFPSPTSHFGLRDLLWHCKACSILGVGFYIIDCDPAIPCLYKHDKFYCNAREILSKAPGIADRVKILPIRASGLSGAGKTTIAEELSRWFTSHSIHFHEATEVYVLDGDCFRQGLNSDLGFSIKDRKSNVRRMAKIAKALNKRGNVVIVSLISPLAEDRLFAKQIHVDDGLKFLECYVATPLEICEERDVKGLYKKFRAGVISNFTGINSPYEEPQNPDVVLDTVEHLVHECVEEILSKLEHCGYIKQRIQSLYADGRNEENIDKLQEEAKSLPLFELTTIDLQFLQILAEGWATPLKGFMREKELLQCLLFMFIIIDGSIQSQSIPIVLPVDKQDKIRLEGQRKIALSYKGDIYATLSDPEFYDYRKEEFAALTFCTTNSGHPSIARIFESGDYLVGGDVVAIKRIMWNDGMDEFRLTPSQLKRKFQQYRADAVYAFQLRNPIHNGHAMLMTETKKYIVSEGYSRPLLLLHPLGGWTKADDVPLKVRIEQHKVILEDRILDPDTTILSIFPSPMMYAGPREVLWHCKARSVLGVNFYIVGRDPAGITHPSKPVDLYEPTHGSKLLSMAPGLVDRMTIVPFRVAAFNSRSRQMEFFDPARANEFQFISGTKMRELARNGEKLPDGFMAPKAWAVLESFYRSLEV